jgi:predicted transposase YbfD/YdcC
VDEESNGITAIPGLLEMLRIAGAIVTIDAMGCQEGVARTVRGRKADDLPALKGNREHRFERVVASFEGACAHGRRAGGIRDHREWSEGQGRDEGRRCWATSDLDRLGGRGRWPDLRSVALIESERFIGDTLAVEERYDLSRPPADAALLNESARSHWAVEDPLHWVWDVTSHGDRSRIKKEDAPADFGLLRRLA